MAVIVGVETRSPAAKAGLSAGDTLRAINGHPIQDVLDYQFYGYDERLELEVLTAAGKIRRVKVRHPEGGDLGLTFESYLMDQKQTCRNGCIFCFIDQLPTGLRDALYFKDDDARLSFLQGNYITLTNLSDEDIGRVIHQRVSPLHISVHTTNPELRVRLLRNKRAGSIFEHLTRLADHNIQMHCQIVVCPGYNDGAELRRTLNDLAQLIPHVASVSVVPVGLTRHRGDLPRIDPVDKQMAQECLQIIHTFHPSLMRKYDKRFFYPADEFFLLADEDLPGGDYYDGYPQYENGVGMVTSFREEFEDVAEQDVEIAPFSIATGQAAAGFITDLLYGLPGRVYSVPNRLLGASVNVAGLVCGADIARALEGKELGERLLIPSVMLRHDGAVFLDDMTPSELSERLHVPVVTVPVSGVELWNALRYPNV